MLTDEQLDAICDRCNMKCKNGLCDKHLEAQEAVTRLEVLDAMRGWLDELWVQNSFRDKHLLGKIIGNMNFKQDEAESQCKELGV